MKLIANIDVIKIEFSHFSWRNISETLEGGGGREKLNF